MSDNFTQVLRDIRDGEFDNDLELLRMAVRERKQLLAQIKGNSIAVGDRVMFNDQVSPKYMVGLKGTVTGRGRSKLKVTPDHGVGRFHGGEVRCPAGILDKIADD